MQLQNSWAAVIFSLFTPIYFVIIITGLTEIFFGFVLTLSLLLLLNRHYKSAAVIISFLPFVRSEGFLLLPLFAIAMLYNKKYFSGLLLTTGFLVYSIAGFFHYNDLWWVIHQNPYTGAQEIYGKGPLFWFVSKNEFILGIPLVVLFIAGIINNIIDYKIISIEEKLLIVGSFIIYFIAHSVFWWKGLFGSLGLVRVVAAVTPLAAIISLRGINFIIAFINNQRLKNIFLAFTVVLVILIPFKQHTFPRPLNQKDKLVKEAVQWIINNELNQHKTYYLYPYIPYFLEKDLFDEKQFSGIYNTNVESVMPGEIIIWDSHFCPNEGRLPAEVLISNPTMKLLKEFSCNTADKPFNIYIFQRQ